MRRNIVITVLFFIGMALLGVFVFSDSYLRLGECFRDLGNSAAYYFCKLFGIESDITVTVNGYSDIFSWGTVLPEDFDEFKQGAGDYVALLFDVGNFAGWGNTVADFLEVALKVLLLALPCVFILIMLVKKLYKSGNTKHGKDTVPLKVFKACRTENFCKSIDFYGCYGGFYGRFISISFPYSWSSSPIISGSSCLSIFSPSTRRSISCS